jgi:hypothetical protein
MADAGLLAASVLRIGEAALHFPNRHEGAARSQEQIEELQREV